MQREREKGKQGEIKGGRERKREAERDKGRQREKKGGRERDKWR